MLVFIDISALRRKGYSGYLSVMAIKDTAIFMNCAAAKGTPATIRHSECDDYPAIDVNTVSDLSAFIAKRRGAHEDIVVVTRRDVPTTIAGCRVVSSIDEISARPLAVKAAASTASNAILTDGDGNTELSGKGFMKSVSGLLHRRQDSFDGWSTDSSSTASSTSTSWAVPSIAAIGASVTSTWRSWTVDDSLPLDKAFAAKNYEEMAGLLYTLRANDLDTSCKPTVAAGLKAFSGKQAQLLILGLIEHAKHQPGEAALCFQRAYDYLTQVRAGQGCFHAILGTPSASYQNWELAKDRLRKFEFMRQYVPDPLANDLPPSTARSFIDPHIEKLDLLIGHKLGLYEAYVEGQFGKTTDEMKHEIQALSALRDELIKLRSTFATARQLMEAVRRVRTHSIYGEGLGKHGTLKTWLGDYAESKGEAFCRALIEAARQWEAKSAVASTATSTASTAASAPSKGFPPQ